MRAKIAVAQIHSVLGDVKANLSKARGLVAAASAQGANIVLLPETFTTGFSFGMQIPEVAETIPGPSSDCLVAMAREFGVYIYGTLIERDGSRFHNCGVFVDPEKGLVAKYRKVHLFSSEKDVFGAGEGPVLVDTPFGRFGLTICYDLCFPEYTRGLVLNGAETILNSTNWLTVGPPHDWDEWQWSYQQTTALAVARALENTVGLAMCCQSAGLSDTIYSFGHSCIVSPSGRILAQLGDEEGVTAAEIPMDRVAGWRATATYLVDRRPDLYREMLGY